MLKNLTLTVLCCILFGVSLSAQNIHKRGELIVQFQKDFEVSTLFSDHFSKKYTHLSHKKCLQEQLNIHQLNFDEEKLNEQVLLDAIRKEPMVLSAQFNHRVTPRSTTPDDRLYDEQWALEQIEAPEVWDFTTGGYTLGGKEIVIAVLDGGYDLDHEDLSESIWINESETPNDGIDNDNNGYVDDYYGWNAENENDDHSKGIQAVDHGTAVMGIIGAKGDNGIGISGINWNVKMMPISGLPYEAEIIEGYSYVLNMRTLYNETNGQEGAFIVATNLSLGIANARAENHPIWCSMYELLGEQGIVSVGATANAPVDVDENGDMPTSCESIYLISVTSSDFEDKKSLTTAFGKRSIDMSAPGIEVLTTRPGDQYRTFGGTSAAAPMVTGAIGLLYSSPCQRLSAQACTIPLETANAVRAMILEGVDENSELEELTASGGRLNLLNSLALANEYCEPEVGSFELELAQNPISVNENIRFTYTSSDRKKRTIISLYSALGQEIFREELSPSLFGEREGVIDLGGRLSTGAYFLFALDGSGRKITKVLMVH